MISQQIEFAAKRLAWKKTFETSNPDINELRRFDMPRPPRVVRWSCKVEETDFEAFNAFTLSRRRPNDAQIIPTILYFHGGSFASGPFFPHWLGLARMALSGKAQVTVLDYPKTPEYQAGKTQQIASQAYHYLRGSRPDAPMILMGDSAGAAVATSLALQLNSEGHRLPDQLILICPFLDATLSHPGIAGLESIDPILSAPGLHALAGQYAGDESLDSPLISPIYGDLSGLPPMQMYVAEKDILRPDAERFLKKARAAGASLDYHEFEGMLHNWQLAPIPEAVKLYSDILNTL